MEVILFVMVLLLGQPPHEQVERWIFHIILLLSYIIYHTVLLFKTELLAPPQASALRAS